MNKAILKGRLQDDLKVIETKNGNKFCTGRMSTYKKRNGENTYENHSLTFWGKSCENALKFLKKGSNILVEGEIKTTTRGEGDQKRYYTGIEVIFFESCDPYEPNNNNNNSNSFNEEDVPF